MTSEERKKLKQALKDYKKKVTASKAASEQFLVELGVFTKKGKVRKEFKSKG